MVKINGKEAADVCGMTVSQYLSANNYNPKHIVVELNEEILPKTEYDSTAIADGDVVEILRPSEAHRCYAYRYQRALHRCDIRQCAR